MKNETIPRILNCIHSQGTEFDWLYDDALAASFTLKKKTIPASVDLREKDWTISNQKSTGSCVGWATADGLLRWNFAKQKNISIKDKMSVRFIWMSAKEIDEFTNRPSTFIEESGTSLKAALDVARKFGCVPETILPFDGVSLYGGSESTFYAMASRYRIINYFNLLISLKSKTDNWKQWLASGNGPILTRLSVDATWDNSAKTKGNLDKYLPDTARGGHAVCIVGYTPDRFIIRNSWGEGWGDKGFAYASYNYAKAAFTEAYGIGV